MTGILLAVQLLFSCIIGLYFFNMLKSQRSTKTSLQKDSAKELERLHKMRQIHLTEPLAEKTRPTSLEDVIGQEDGVRALRAALCGKNPQHVLIYGSAGIGKTAAARVVLEEAKKNNDSPFGKQAKFIEADATTMRFDERNIADPLIGSVHDPIYQGAGAYGVAGVPQPKEGAVTKAHGGVLFIDEIGELHPIQLNRLLKVLEDRKVMLESAYYSAEDTNIPRHIHDIFQNGLPADFRLIGATTRSPEEIPLAIRSRCTEIFFHDLSYEDFVKIAHNAIQKLQCKAEEGVCEFVANYAQNGRDCVNMLQRSASVMWMDHETVLQKKHVRWVIETGQYVPKMIKKLPEGARIGFVNGLAVSGTHGYVMDIEAIASKNAEKKGKVIVTGIIETEQLNGRHQNLYKTSSAKGSVDNVMTLLHKKFGVHQEEYDIHINFPGGMPVDGPSAGISIFCAVYSAVFRQEIDSQVAMTGEISLRGCVLPVGGITHKVKAAMDAGAHRVYIPAANQKECMDIKGIKMIPVDTIEDVMVDLFASPAADKAGASLPAIGDTNQMISASSVILP